MGKAGDDSYFYYVMELADDASEATLERGLEEDASLSDVLTEVESDGHHEVATPSASRSGAGDRASSGSRRIDPNHYDPKTLRSELRRLGRLPVSECLRLGASLAEALAHLQENGLVHRDIKPSNVIFVNGVSGAR